MGEFYVETGLSTIGMSDYKRILSLDSAMAVVQFKNCLLYTSILPGDFIKAISKERNGRDSMIKTGTSYHYPMA